MALDAKLEVLQDGAQKALMGGEEIASAANTMFQGLEHMHDAMRGQAGNVFQTVQSTMMTNLTKIDEAMNKVGNGILDSSMVFNQADDDNSISINQALGDDTVALLTNGR
ncbi:MAG TPA: WXG100 family type VII secretion target [Candidatus Stackebrandtia excrementipullorum]|nr:WXG100 family type VII secretion target [Candidatus Stackebrandtia excrementipullorum]